MAFGQWSIAEQNEKTKDGLVDALGVGWLTAATLAARGYDTPKKAKAFLHTDIEIEDPFALKDMDKAAERIRAAIESGETIAVYGDYDVDGVTATALMVQFLMGCGARVLCSLPTRDASGYGLSNEAIDNLARYDVGLIVTVDNGISSYDEVAYAKALGIDVVVCDHHLPPPQLPDAVAVVDPLRADDTSTYKDLAGVGVALKLAAAVEDCDVAELMPMYGYLAAIGTISDIMPLTGENRAVVSAGLDMLKDCDSPGLQALCAACEVDMAALDAHKVAFTLAPRLNAAGRMGSADLALQLLLCEDIEEAQGLADELIELNTLRRTAENEVTDQIAAIIAADRDILKKPVIIVAAPDLHSGVTGIVCSRMVDRYGKPVIIISIEDGEGKGSGRSVAGFSLHDAIEACSGLLRKYGGHDMAAGFTLDSGNIEAFKQEIFAYCGALRNPIARPQTLIDAELRFKDIGEDEVAGLGVLEPFGCSNETPVFCARDLEVADIVPLGEAHSRVTLRQGGASLTGAVFGKTPQRLPYNIGDKVDAAFVLSIYASKHKEMVSVRFKEIRRAGLTDADFAVLDAYDRLTTGRPLDEAQRELLAPAREDIAAVYRVLQKQPADRYDTGALCFLFGGLSPGKAAAAIDILEELALVAPAGRDGMIRAAANPQKRDLSESVLFQTLHGKGTA